MTEKTHKNQQVEHRDLLPEKLMLQGTGEMLTGRNPQLSLHGPAWSFMGWPHPVLDVERATASPKLPPSIFWKLVLTLLFNRRDAPKGRGPVFVFQTALARFPGPLGAPGCCRGAGAGAECVPPAQLSRTAELSTSPPMHPSSQIPGEQLFSLLHTPSNPQLNRL